MGLSMCTSGAPPQLLCIVKHAKSFLHGTTTVRHSATQGPVELAVPHLLALSYGEIAKCF